MLGASVLVRAEFVILVLLPWEVGAGHRRRCPLCPVSKKGLDPPLS